MSSPLSRLAAAFVVVEAYFLLAPELPDLGAGDAAYFLTTIIALVGACLLIVSVIDLRDNVPALASLAVVGASAGLLLSAPVPEGAAPFKALFGASAGYLLARLIPIGAIVYLLAIAVAIADAVSVSVGPTNYLVEEQPDVVEYLALSIPAWGGEMSLLGVSDTIFFAVYLLTAKRFGLRYSVTAAALPASLALTLAIAIWTDWTMPALPLLSLALLLPNADLVWRGIREDLKKLD